MTFGSKSLNGGLIDWRHVETALLGILKLLLADVLARRGRVLHPSTEKDVEHLAASLR